MQGKRKDLPSKGQVWGWQYREEMSKPPIILSLPELCMGPGPDPETNAESYNMALRVS